MPIFEFGCRACGEVFEDLVARADAPAPPCPRCGAGEVERRISAFAVTAGRPSSAPGPCGGADCACRRRD
jgi:putative FmdB family regulatory protein